MAAKDPKNLRKKYDRLSHLNNLLKVRLSAYEELSRIIRAEEDMGSALNHTLDLIIGLFGVSSGSIMLLDRTGAHMEISVARGKKASLIKKMKVSAGKGIAGKVARSGKSLLVRDAASCGHFDSEIGRKIGYIPKNLLCVPVANKRTVLGVIEIMDKPGGGFTPDDQTLLEAIAGTIALAILNVNSYKLVRAAVKKLQTLIEVSKSINTTKDLPELLECIMESAKDVLSAEGSSLMLIDEATNELVFNVTTGTAKEKLKQVKIPFGKGIAGIVAETGKGIIVNDAVNDPRVFKEADKTTRMVTRNILAVPMRVKEKVVGVLEAINALDREGFDAYELEFFQAFADHAGIAIFNRDLIGNLRKANQEINRSYKEIKAMYEMSNKVTNETDFGRLFKVAAEVISRIFGLDRVSIMLYDETRSALIVREAVGIDEKLIPQIRAGRTEGVAGFVFDQNKPLLMADMGQDHFFGGSKAGRYRTGSFISVPLRLREKVIGVLNVTERRDRLPFDEKDLLTFVAISNQISKSYENIIYYNEFLEKQRMAKELEITRNIQQNVLPKEFPRFDDLDISAVNISAKEVGGDFYDYIKIDDERHCFLIADVSGKSLPASMFMAFARSVTRVEAYNLVTPSRVLEESNRYIYRDSQSGMFVTMFYMMLDRGKKEILYGSAGHNEQLLYRREQNDFQYLKVRGKPLGVKADITFLEQPVGYARGDIAVLFTDGVSEAMNREGLEFGVDRLKEIILKHRSENACAIRDRVLESINEFTLGLPQFDDITLMILKFT